MNKQEILSHLDIKNFYLSELPSLKSSGAGMGMALCPFHNDHKPSLSINLNAGKGQFKCHGCGEKGDIFTFYQKKHNLDFQTALRELERQAGLLPEVKRKIVKTYDYRDAEDKLIFQVCRYEPKSFSQRRPDGKGGWIYNLQGITPITYNLPEVIKSENKDIFIVEGEKDVESLQRIGLVASCNPMGAGKWRPEFNQYSTGKRVVIIPDNDEVGRNHALQVAENLKGIAESVKIVELPDIPEKGDVSDWIAQGHTKEKLTEIIKNTPEWTPKEPESLLNLLLKWNDILGLDVRVEYILEKLIPKNSITLLFGRGGIGKTSLCMQIARTVANGLPFDTLQTIKTPTYYIDFENPLAVLKERVEKIGESDNLYVWHISNELQPPKLDSQRWELYKGLPPGLIIFDTLRASHLSDENDSKPMSLIMGRLKELREMGFTILLLHHTPKGNDNTFKGSTALLDLCDHVLGLEEIKEPEGNIEFDTDNLYSLGVRIKTRYEPHHIHLTFNPEIKGFKVAVDPDIEKMEGIRDILTPEGLKQKEIKEQLKADDIQDKEARRLLKKGEGIYWEKIKGNEKHSYLYKPINSNLSKCPAYRGGQIDILTSSEPKTIDKLPYQNNPESPINTKSGNLSEGIGQIDILEKNNFNLQEGVI